MTMQRPRTEELLAAYADGGELTEEERASVEALLSGSPSARLEVEAIGDLLGALREAQPEPPPATEAVVRAVRIACATPPTWSARARAWLRRRWPIAVPIAIAAVGAIVVVTIAGGARAPAAPRAPIATTPPTPVPAPVAPAPATAGDDAPLWLDGETAELGALDDDAADELDQELADELAAIGDDLVGDDPGAFDGILPGDDLDWVDELDDATVDELDQWLAEQPS